MAFKFILFFALAAAASAQYHHDSHEQQHHIQVAPVLLKSVGPAYHHADAGHHEEEHYGPAQYEFSYSVHDEKHGDVKHQKETRHGDQVQGEYSLIEPDGHRRTVKYSSDKHTGFVAEVHREEVPGYKAPVQASYHQGGDSHGYGNAGYVQKIAVAPVHTQHIVAAPVYQKVAVAAPVYVSHGGASYAQSSGSSHGSSGHLGLGHYSTGSGLTKGHY